MFSQRVRSVMEASKVLTASPDATVRGVAQEMATKKVGAAMVVEDGRLVGIFTERDAVFRVLARGLDPDRTRLAEVMTASPRTIDPEDTFGYALNIMHENGFRHLPVIRDGKPVGIVSARSALDPDLEEFVSEAQRRSHFQQRRS